MHGLHQVRPRHPADPIIAKPSFPREEGAQRAWATALALLVLAVPLANPDLFWHLSSGRWIWQNGRVPTSDPFSFTRGGEPWRDFEWLFQLAVYGLERAGGLWLLRLVKAALLAACWLPINGLLRDRAVGPTGRCLALAFWAAVVFPQSDLRPDLLSLLFFSILLRRLDRPAEPFPYALPLFILWANVHAGFVFGLLLYAVMGLSCLLERRPFPKSLAVEAAAAVLGTFVNPYGWRVWEVVILHGAQGASISRYVQEWGIPSLRSPMQWSYFAALVLFARLARHHYAVRPPFPLLVGLGAAVASVVSARFGLFFAAAGASFLFTVHPRPQARYALPGLAVLTALMLPAASRLSWARPLTESYVASRAVEFIVREDAVLRGLRMFNTYEWGGYLGWRRPGAPVFGDGRYLFHGQLPEAEAALASAPAFADFVARHRLEAVLIKNYPNRLPTKRRYKDGTETEFLRPWHLFLLPRERWALVYFDRQALLFVDRAKVSADWLYAHEYRWLRPGDEAALADALSRGEVPAEALEAERVRQAAESRPL